MLPSGSEQLPASAAATRGCSDWSAPAFAAGCAFVTCTVRSSDPVPPSLSVTLRRKVRFAVVGTDGAKNETSFDESPTARIEMDERVDVAMSNLNEPCTG